jgi:hypothetical protein
VDGLLTASALLGLALLGFGFARFFVFALGVRTLLRLVVGFLVFDFRLFGCAALRAIGSPR